MLTRILPPEEWPRLFGTEAEAVWPHLDSRTSQVLVVEDADGAIVGTWTLMHVLHAECLWIAPEHRGGAAVARRLLAGLREHATQRGATSVATSAISDDVKALLVKLKAEKLDGDHYLMRLSCLPQ